MLPDRASFDERLLVHLIHLYEDLRYLAESESFAVQELLQVAQKQLLVELSVKERKLGLAGVLRVLQETVQRQLHGQASLHTAMYDEHGSDEYYVLLVVDVYFRQISLVVSTLFLGLRSGTHWNVDLCCYRFIIVSGVLY